jgi:hypothetical protein
MLQTIGLVSPLVVLLSSYTANAELAVGSEGKFKDTTIAASSQMQ